MAVGFEDLSEDNDPYGEHDHASFEAEDGETYWFKVDYYIKDLLMGSANPIDPQLNTLVYTLLRWLDQ